MPIMNTIKLLGSVLDASTFFPPNHIFSIMGSPKQLIPPYHPNSEYSFFDPSELPRIMSYLEEVSLLPIPIPYHYVNWLPIPETLFLRETHVFSYPKDSQSDENFPKEAWFFINGIGTNLDMAMLNCKYLYELFHRRIVGIQNPTDSILVDLLECAVGKRWKRSMSPAQTALEPISKALNDPNIERVILIGHSQGTIISANILRSLIEDNGQTYVTPFEENMKKLEMYLFATCSDNMEYIPDVKTSTGHPVPYIENFANGNDLVARFGMISPRKELWGISIDGDMYVRKNAWGHLLNAHYLNGFDTSRSDYEPFRSLTKNGATPRLFGYLDGSTPLPY